MIEDLEDNYTNYLDDALGYTWDAWEILSLGQIDRHDAVLWSTDEEREKVDLALANDLERWAYCRATRRDDDLDAFLESGRLILGDHDPHAGLRYDEIASVVILEMANQQLFDEARLVLERSRTKFQEQTSEWDRVDANVAYRESKSPARFREIFSEHEDELEYIFELAEDLLVLGDVETAKEFADHIAANCADSSAIWVDLQTLQRTLAD